MPAPAHSIFRYCALGLLMARLIEAQSPLDLPDPTEPCVDFSGNVTEEADEARRAGEDCDPEAELFLHSEPAQEKLPESRSTSSPSSSSSTSSSSSLSFTLGQLPGQPARSIVRTRASSNGWDHRFEFRGDSLTRRKVGWTGTGWRLIAGDLTDPAFPVWPRALPRRTLPVGWKAAHTASSNTSSASSSFSQGVLSSLPQSVVSSLPQGLAAGVSGRAWSAYALRAWNPVETNAEPPWRAPWTLRHFAAGLSATPETGPFAASLHLSETRITRGASDTVAERLLAAEISTNPSANANATSAIARAQKSGSYSLLVARMESDRVAGNPRAGHLVDARLRRRFRNTAALEYTIRQREAAWRSAWDPVVSADAVYGNAYATNETTDTDAPDALDPRGAGETRITGSWPLEWNSTEASEVTQGKLRGEFWRAWNPAAHTQRQGVRGIFEWHTESAELEKAGSDFTITATHRTTRTASGGITLFRYLEAATRQREFPRWNLAAWRAWNGDGPLRTGLQWGAEPTWGRWRTTAGLRVETEETNKSEEAEENGVSPVSDQWVGTAVLGLRGRFGTRWKLDASGSIPCARHGVTEGTRWRLILETTR
jgi:hypothetical protein